MELTRDNYYTPEADMAFMSCSQYQSFNECEAKALAEIQGRWVKNPSDAFNVGNYFHTYFEGSEAHEQFIQEHEDEIFLKATKADIAAGVRRKKAPYEKADEMIRTAENDELIKTFIDMPGENEKIMTGVLFGVPWRIRVDKYIPDGRMIIDWKTCASITELKWSDVMREKVSFIEAYEYLFRAAVYTEIEKQYTDSVSDPNFIIVAISKQDPPDKDVFLLNHRQRYEYELEQVKKRIPYIQAIKEGRMLPKRCGCCAYCRATKRLQSIKPYYVLMPDFREETEDDIPSAEGTMLVDTQKA